MYSITKKLLIIPLVLQAFTLPIYETEYTVDNALDNSFIGNDELPELPLDNPIKQAIIDTNIDDGEEEQIAIGVTTKTVPLKYITTTSTKTIPATTLKLTNILFDEEETAGADAPITQALPNIGAEATIGIPDLNSLTKGTKTLPFQVKTSSKALPTDATTKGLPSKELPSKTLPSKELPTKALPSDVTSKTLPSKELPTKALPSEAPSKTLPSKDLPTKELPTSAPSKTLPSKTLPSKTLPSKSLPSDAPSKSLPTKDLPTAKTIPDDLPSSKSLPNPESSIKSVDADEASDDDEGTIDVSEVKLTDENENSEAEGADVAGADVANAEEEIANSSDVEPDNADVANADVANAEEDIANSSDVEPDNADVNSSDVQIGTDNDSDVEEAQPENSPAPPAPIPAPNENSGGDVASGEADDIPNSSDLEFSDQEVDTSNVQISTDNDNDVDQAEVAGVNVTPDTKTPPPKSIPSSKTLPSAPKEIPNDLPPKSIPADLADTYNNEANGEASEDDTPAPVPVPAPADVAGGDVANGKDDDIPNSSDLEFSDQEVDTSNVQISTDNDDNVDQADIAPADVSVPSTKNVPPPSTKNIPPPSTKSVPVAPPAEVPDEQSDVDEADVAGADQANVSQDNGEASNDEADVASSDQANVSQDNGEDSNDEAEVAGSNTPSAPPKNLSPPPKTPSSPSLPPKTPSPQSKTPSSSPSLPPKTPSPSSKTPSQPKSNPITTKIPKSEFDDGVNFNVDIPLFNDDTFEEAEAGNTSFGESNLLSSDSDFTVPKNKDGSAPIQAPDVKNGKDFTQSDYEDYLNDVQDNIKKSLLDFAEESE